LLERDLPRLQRPDRLVDLFDVIVTVAALVTQLDNPYGYGRVVRDGIGRIRAA